MQVAQVLFFWFEAGELDQVAVLKEVGKADFLIRGQVVSGLQFDQELFGRAVRRMKLKPFLQVHTQGV